MSTLRENLKAVRALIAKGWTQEAYARDARGFAVNFDSDEAECYCLRGATLAAADSYSCCADLQIALSLPLSDGLIAYNDFPGRTQADVLALIDRAIEAAA